MSLEKPRRTAAENKEAAEGATPVASRSKARTPMKAASGWSTVLVSLRGIDEAREQAADGRASQYAAMRTLARERRSEVLDYLRANAEPDGWRKPSEVTAFGTFTVDCTPSALRVLRHAPHVQSIVRVADTPLRVIR
jgi:hypothetical protein